MHPRKRPFLYHGTPTAGQLPAPFALVCGCGSWKLVHLRHCGNVVDERNLPTRAIAATHQGVALLQGMNLDLLPRSGANQDIEGVINSYELGFRMQACVPNLMDIRRESQQTRDRYGIDGGQTDDFGRQCLMTRRLAEVGVRFIEVCPNTNGDTHGGLSTHM